MTDRLFVYGSLRNRFVQDEVFGRVPHTMTPATLPDYMRSTVTIGETRYPTILPHPHGHVHGFVYEVNGEELLKIDRYETKAYARTSVTLADGTTAWAYVKAA